MVGTVSQAGTRVFIGGTASGIDTAALIDAAVQQKTFKADRLDIEIDDNTAKIAAYSELQSLADNFKQSLASLKGNPGIFDEGESVFNGKAGTVTTSDGKDFASIVDIAIDSNAAVGNYEVEIIQEAKSQRVLSTAAVTDPMLDMGYTGTFEMGLSGNPPGYLVNITANMSLSEIAAVINAAAEPREVIASVVKVNENDFRLVLEGAETNQTILANASGGDDILGLLGVTDGAGGFISEIQEAQPALIEFNGVQISRDSNTFDGLVEGVEFTIKNESPGTVMDIQIGNDTIGVKDAIVAMVESYNAFRDFVVKNQQVSADGVVSEDAVLFGDRLLSGMASTYSDFFSDTFDNEGSIRTIRDLGITFTANNKLEISNEVALDNAILNNFDEVRSAFASSGVSDNADFALLGSTSSISTQNIIFDITMDGAGVISDVSVGGNNSLFTVNGRDITGAAGSIYEGLRFSYQGATSTTVNFQLDQGLANKVINGVSGYTDPVRGLIIQEKAALQTDNQGKAEDAQEIRDRAESFRERQIAKYADFEAKLQQLETLKSQIRAILGTDKDDD